MSQREDNRSKYKINHLKRLLPLMLHAQHQQNLHDTLNASYQHKQQDNELNFTNSRYIETSSSEQSVQQQANSEVERKESVNEQAVTMQVMWYQWLKICRKSSKR